MRQIHPEDALGTPPFGLRRYCSCPLPASTSCPTRVSERLDAHILGHHMMMAVMPKSTPRPQRGPQGGGSGSAGSACRAAPTRPSTGGESTCEGVLHPTGDTAQACGCQGRAEGDGRLQLERCACCAAHTPMQGTGGDAGAQHVGHRPARAGGPALRVRHRVSASACLTLAWAEGPTPWLAGALRRRSRRPARDGAAFRLGGGRGRAARSMRPWRAVRVSTTRITACHPLSLALQVRGGHAAAHHCAQHGQRRLLDARGQPAHPPAQHRGAAGQPGAAACFGALGRGMKRAGRLGPYRATRGCGALPWRDGDGTHPYVRAPRTHGTGHRPRQAARQTAGTGAEQGGGGGGGCWSQAEGLLADCQEFLQSEAWYARHGVFKRTQGLDQSAGPHPHASAEQQQRSTCVTAAHVRLARTPCRHQESHTDAATCCTVSQVRAALPPISLSPLQGHQGGTLTAEGG